CLCTCNALRSTCISSLLFFYSSADPRHLHSFPTRRSSDLRTLAGQEPDVIQHRLPVESLARIHSRLAGSADGAVAQQVSQEPREDRKSTRLNSSHVKISYAVFCLKKKKKKPT